LFGYVTKLWPPGRWKVKGGRRADAHVAEIVVFERGPCTSYFSRVYDPLLIAARQATNSLDRATWR
jgi:hypothetical protein